MSLVRNLKRTQKINMMRKVDPSPKAREKMNPRKGVDQEAETGTKVEHQSKTRKTKAENAAGVRTEDATETIREEKRPGTGTVELEVQIETKPAETQTETGTPGVGVGAKGEIVAESASPIEEIKTEKLLAEEEDAAAAPTVTGTRRGRGRRVAPSPETEEVPQNRGLIVQKTKRRMTTRRKSQTLGQVQVLTVIDPESGLEKEAWNCVIPPLIFTTQKRCSLLFTVVDVQICLF